MGDESRREDWVKVFTGSPTDAEMVRGVLEGSGIAAVINRVGGGAYGLDPGPLGETTVYVRSEDETSARDLLGEVEDAPLGDQPDEDQAIEGEPNSPIRAGGKWVMQVAVIVVIAILLIEAAR